MAKNQPDPFKTIDTRSLDTVSGGMATARSGAMVAAQAHDPMLEMLTALETSVQQLASQQSPMMQLLQMFEIMHGINPNAMAAPPAAKPLVASTQGAWKSKK